MTWCSFSEYADEDWPEDQYAALAHHAARHPLTGRPWWYPLLKPILPFLSEAANDRIYARFK